MERIGIFGGTFNPPHIGHIFGAQEAVKALGLDRLLLIPDRNAPHKQLPEDTPSWEHRLEMLRLSVTDPRLEVLALEQDGVSFAYLTVEQVKARFPEAKLYLLLGSDKLSTVPQWKQADVLRQQVTLAVLYRGQKGENDEVLEQTRQLREQGFSVELVNNQAKQISSTRLRRLLRLECAEPWLPQGVEKYIRAHGLYGTGENCKQLPMDRLEQVVIGLLKPNRVKHVLGCRDTCVELAKHWGADETDAARAGLLHDITKALDGPDQLTLCDAYGTLLDEFSRRYPKTLHALTGSLVARKIFGENEQVVAAICHHTTGKANMSLLEKIVYVADYMEPNRDFPGVERLRQLAFEDLDKALLLGLNMTMQHLANQNAEVSPQSKEAIAWLESHAAP